jgi:RecA-family ATPase
MSLDMLGNGIDEQTIFEVLRARVPDTDKPDKELRAAIRWAKSRNPTPSISRYTKPALSETATAIQPRVKKFKSSGERTKLPQAHAGVSVSRFLEDRFRPDDLICVTFPDSNGNPNRDEIHTCAEWVALARLQPSVLEDEYGIYFLPNPVKSTETRTKEACGHESTGHCNAHVKEHQHLLVELEIFKDDRAKYSPEEQEAIIEQYYNDLLASNLPFSWIAYSGGPSVHGLVEINAKDEAERTRMQEAIWNYWDGHPGFDKSNSNTGRLIRLPGAVRDGKRQILLSWETGAASFVEWHNSIQTYAFEIEDLASLVEENPELPDVLVEDFLHKSSIASITGGMKTNKSWTLMNMAISMATGSEWFGRECKQSTVLYIDAEVNRKFWQDRFRKLCNALGLDPLQVARTGRIKPVFLSGKDITISQLNSDLVRMHEYGKLDDIDAIVIDPIYQLYEPQWQENRNEDMAQLGKYLRSLAELSQIAVIFAHHHSKGMQEGKRDIEMASGGGSFGRFVASNLAISYAGTDKTSKYKLGWTTSHFKKQDDEVWERDGFIWTATDEDPTKLGRANFQISDIMAYLPNEGLPSSEWYAACRVGLDISETAFETVRAQASKAGYIKHVKKGGDKWLPHQSWLNQMDCAPIAESVQKITAQDVDMF